MSNELQAVIAVAAVVSVLLDSLLLDARAQVVLMPLLALLLSCTEELHGEGDGLCLVLNELQLLLQQPQGHRELVQRQQPRPLVAQETEALRVGGQQLRDGGVEGQAQGRQRG